MPPKPSPCYRGYDGCSEMCQGMNGKRIPKKHAAGTRDGRDPTDREQDRRYNAHHPNCAGLPEDARSRQCKACDAPSDHQNICCEKKSVPSWVRTSTTAPAAAIANKMTAATMTVSRERRIPRASSTPYRLHVSVANPSTWYIVGQIQVDFGGLWRAKVRYANNALSGPNAHD